MVPEPELPEDAAEVLRDRFSFYQWPGSHILVYLVASEELEVRPGFRRYNWVWYRNADSSQLRRIMTDRHNITRDYSIPPGELAPDITNELYAAAEKWLPTPFAKLVKSTREPFVQPIVDLAVPRMVHGRAILIGDAAFVPRPHTAASTAQAAANALALVDALVVGGDPSAALTEWEREPLALGRYLQQKGQTLGNRSQFPGNHA